MRGGQPRRQTSVRRPTICDAQTGDELWTFQTGSGHRGFKTPLTALPEDVRERLDVEGLTGTILIDFEYPPWHTLDDTPEHCSAKSLQAVGDVIGEWVYGRR